MVVVTVQVAVELRLGGELDGLVLVPRVEAGQLGVALQRGLQPIRGEY